MASLSFSGKNQETRFDVGSKQYVRYGVFNVMWNNLEKWKCRRSVFVVLLTAGREHLHKQCVGK